MLWDPKEIAARYRSLGGDYNALVNLLKEVQLDSGGTVPRTALPVMAEACGVKESYLLAIIRRLPSLRLADTHLLELCAGKNCGRHTELAAFAESLKGKNITVKFVSCMRLCGKGPNIRWDGKLYHGADEVLLRQLTEE